MDRVAALEFRAASWLRTTVLGYQSIYSFYNLHYPDLNENCYYNVSSHLLVSAR